MSGSKTEQRATQSKYDFIKNSTDGLVVSNGEVIRYSTRLKYYGDDLAEIMMCSKSVFNPDGVYKCSSQHRKQHQDNDYEQSADDTLARSKRRARQAVFDYAMCNPDLDVFITFTLNGEKIDRYDYNAVMKKLNVWFRNRVQRNSLKYVFVCEKHKDGAVHFHGLANSAALKMEDSGHKDKRGHTVYNVKDWVLGFSTAVRCYGERSSVCKYIVKYITKSDEKVGGRWYYSGGALNAPRYEYMGKTELADWDGLEGYVNYTKHVESAGLEYSVLSKKY